MMFYSNSIVTKTCRSRIDKEMINKLIKNSVNWNIVPKAKSTWGGNVHLIKKEILLGAEVPSTY